jgi:outer membrane protein OmpA-like peptidoglycan-associated protein
MKLSVLILMILNSLALYSQNIIVNPDFSDVTIVYENGKKVFPNNWKSFDWPFPQFYHLANEVSGNVFGKQSENINSKGIIGIRILRPSIGIFTKLKEPLILGQVYDVDIELRIEKLKLNSNFVNRNAETNEIIDSANLDYNFVIPLITYFSPTEFNQLNKDKRSFLILNFPANITPDSTGWIKLSQTYTASGNEEFFAIGTNNSEDYLEILRNIKGDTIDYTHKWAYYLIRNISIFPKPEGKISNLNIVDSFQFDLQASKIINERFVLRKINFDLNSYLLSDDSKFELNKMVTFMKSNLDYNLYITGHTDTIGTEQYNLVLSINRAKAVYDYLIAQGVMETRLSYEGKGESQALNNNQQKENLGKNRRVEFEFKKKKQ